MQSVVFLASAEQDLKSLKHYVCTQFSEKSWQQTYAKIKKEILGLQEFPESGHIPFELEALQMIQYRQIFVEKNRIIYEVQDSRIYIHLIVDVRQSLEKVLLSRIIQMI